MMITIIGRKPIVNSYVLASSPGPESPMLIVVYRVKYLDPVLICNDGRKALLSAAITCEVDAFIEHISLQMIFRK